MWLRPSRSTYERRDRLDTPFSGYAATSALEMWVPLLCIHPGPPLVVSEADVLPCARPQQGASMKAPTPFWSLAVVSILAFELTPSACSFSSERPVGGVGGNNGSPATGGQTGSAGNAGLAGTSGGQGGGFGGSNLGVDA